MAGRQAMNRATLGDALWARMQAQLDREIMAAMTCTAATAPPGPTLTREALLEMAETPHVP